MRVQEVMSGQVRTIVPYTSIQDAAKMMASENVGMLPVVEYSGHLKGVVTDRDITIRSLAIGLWPHSPIDRIMTLNPKTISPDADLEQAIDAMVAAQVGRLIVTDGRAHVVGVVSLGDIQAKGDVGHLIPLVSKALGRRSTAISRIPDQLAHVG